MQVRRQTYNAVIWETTSSVGKPVTVMAESLDDARINLEGEYGKGTVFDLHNEIEASTPR